MPVSYAAVMQPISGRCMRVKSGLPPGLANVFMVHTSSVCTSIAIILVACGINSPLARERERERAAQAVTWTDAQARPFIISHSPEVNQNEPAILVSLRTV